MYCWLYTGLFSGMGTRWVWNPRSGMLTGKICPRERGRGRGRDTFQIAGMRTFWQYPSGMYPLPSLIGTQWHERIFIAWKLPNGLLELLNYKFGLLIWSNGKRIASINQFQYYRTCVSSGRIRKRKSLVKTHVYMHVLSTKFCHSERTNHLKFLLEHISNKYTSHLTPKLSFNVRCEQLKTPFIF